MKTGLVRPTPRRRQPFPSEAPSGHVQMRAAGPTADGEQTGRPQGSAVGMPNLVRLSCEEVAAPSGERRESPGRGGGGAATRDREAALAEHVWAFVPERDRGISAAEELTGSSGSPAVKEAWRSIYDTMRINEQIDQGSKLNQPSKSTLEKGDVSTISSNGTLGAPGGSESKAPEGKKLDERVIFDALKLSSDVPKSAPAPPRRRPNPEKKENINRRSWKSFMPPNFPEFAERIEASLSEVSEAGISNPSLQEKQDSSTLLESPRQSGHGESMSEPLTMEHVTKSPGVPEIQVVKQLSDAFCEFSQDENQPLLEPEDTVAELTGSSRRWDHRLASATWPRVVKNAIKAGLGAGRHDTLEADDSDCVIETVPLSPCLSEELLDPEMSILITPSLREKTESELRFEEDERLIMMEAEEVWEEEGLLSEREKTVEKRHSGLTDISEEREQLSAPVMTVVEAGESFAGVQGTSNHPSPWQEGWDDSQLLQPVSSAPVPQETHRDFSAALREGDADDDCPGDMATGHLELEGFASRLEPLVLEQLSDTDSVQMFLELEKLCMDEDEGEGVALIGLEVRDSSLCSEELDPQKDLEQLSENSAETSQHLLPLEASTADSAVVSDLEDFDATYSSQIASTTEPTLSESYSEREMFGDSEKVLFASPPIAKNAVSQHSLSSLVSQIEEHGAESVTIHRARELLGSAVVSAEVSCCEDPPPCVHIFTVGGEIEGQLLPVACWGTEETSPKLDKLSTAAEELDSQADLGLINDVSTKERRLDACSEPIPSERTDVSNWDVPELVSEDEVAELDKENIPYESHVNETENVDSSWMPLQSGFVLEQDSREPLNHPGSSEDLKSEDPTLWGQLEHLSGLAGDREVSASTVSLQPQTPVVAEQVRVGSPVAEGDFLEYGVLESLFGQGAEDEPLRDGEGGIEPKYENASSTLCVEFACAAQPSAKDLASSVREEVASVCCVPSGQAPDTFPDCTEELVASVGSLASGPATPEKPMLSLLADSAPGVGASSPDTDEDLCGTDGLPTDTGLASAKAFTLSLPSPEEASFVSVPLCLENQPVQSPSQDELPSWEESTGAVMANSSEELIQVIPALDLPLPWDTGGQADATALPDLEESFSVLISDVLWNAVCSTQQQSASGAPEMEEEPAWAVLDTEGPSASSLAAEEPPAGTHGLVPDNETFQKEQVDPLQLRLQQVNGLGQGLIQSAGKNCDVQGLEHDMEDINTRWNTLNKKVAQRIAQLQEALLHCGKFQDALEPLLSWLVDTEELISNQKPPSAEYKVVKAQIQEQKLLQRLLDDRKATVEMIQAEGGRIAQSAEPVDREKIAGQLESLGSRWAGLLSKASARQNQLEEILVLAKQFHETSEPISDWLSVTEKKLANSEPIGTQTAKIQQQITRHKALEEEIESRAAAVALAVRTGQSLSSLSCRAEQALLADKLDLLESRYDEICDRCGRKAALLDQALANARLFGEDEVEVLNWLAEVGDKLISVSVKDYQRDVLQKQHAEQLALNDEILNRKKNVDQAIKNGQALLKQTTGEEVLLIQEKLDGIKTRYSDITTASSKALRTLEQARQLATKFQATHEELTGWMSQVEEELTSGGGYSPTGEQIPQFQQRQKELKKEVMEHRLILDTVNEVSRALLELVPWRAREGLDKLVSDTNERYKLISDTIKQRVEEIDAAIQRSQQYEQAADAELAWVAETKRKLMALGPIRLEQDQTTAQLQVQKAFSIDIIRHKDSVDELFSQRSEILGTCGEEQKAMLQEKTESLANQYDEVSHLNSERYACLERAQVLVNQFWETYEELSPWLEEMQALIGQLPPPAIDHEHLKQQQEDMRQWRESIAEHKPHIDKLLKIGPQLKELNPEEGEMVQEKYSLAEATYSRIKEEVRQRALALDEAISQSTQFHDKIEPMLETLENLSSRLRMPPLIPAEVEKIRECISDNKNATMELEKLQPSFGALKRRGEELIGRSQGADEDLAAKEIQDKLDQMVFFWEDIKARAEEREIKFLDVLELAEKFWYDMAALLTTIRDTQDIVHDLESPGIDPSIIKQQVEAAETIKEETDGLHEELEFIRILGADLIFACGETEKPEVKKSIDEMNSAWENLNKTWKERLEKLEEAMQSAVQYQDTLQAMFDWLDNTVIKLCNMPPVGTDLNTVKEQLNEMKEFKMEVYQQQIEMEKLNHQGELMLKKATDETDRDIIREPLTELKHLWENLGEKIAHRQEMNAYR
ncbi:UNVERIFIED_CONTAM: hypothetical protein K2H54_044089 [Gekko kuhli]